MLDIVAPHNDQLALSVQRKGVDQTEPRLARLAAPGKPQAMAKQRTIGDNQRSNRDNHYSREHRNLQRGFVAKRKIS